MEKEREIEVKSLISEDKYLELLSDFEKLNQESLPIYRQTNHYFDSNDLILQSKNIVLRIREKKGKLQLTAKIPQNNQFNVQDSEELNHYLEGEDIHFYLTNGLSSTIPFIDDLINILNLPNNIDFKFIGTLITDRKDIKIGNDTISLDKNYYNGIIDYELEWETNEVEKTLKEFSKLNVEAGNSKSKIKRFMSSVK